MVHLNWNNLQTALQKMRATGPEGFEGIAALILEELTGERLFIARTGDQPGGDAGSVLGRTRMQAKRYTSAKLTEAQVEADFHAARRATPQLDVYVLAVTKATLQLAGRLDQLRSETAIDILLLDWTGSPPALGALCVTFWSKIANVPELRDLGQDFATWAEAQAHSDEVKKRVEQIRLEITAQLSGFEELRQRALTFLKRRFGFLGPALPRFPILLASAIERKIVSTLIDWWNSEKRSLGVVVGEQGMGKSWLAAACALQIAENNNVLVFWLESDDWKECATLEEVVTAALRGFGYRSDDVARRITRRILQRWADRILIVLDGANESGALETAQSVITDFLNRESPRTGLLFTTRPLENREAFRPSLWGVSNTFELGPLNDEELGTALAHFDPPIETREIPPALMEFARIPRYLGTCVRLRKRFGNFHDVTRELVLWVDLLDRIENGDPQIRQLIGWTAETDAADVLMALATKARFDEANRSTAAYEVLDECFGGRYEAVRRELTEIGIAELATPRTAHLNRAHVVLGFALYLEQLLARAEGTTRELADVIRKALEPLVSVDERTEAVFVALQLTALKQKDSSHLRHQIRSSLLLVWASLQERLKAPITRESKAA